MMRGHYNNNNAITDGTVPPAAPRITTIPLPEEPRNRTSTPATEPNQDANEPPRLTPAEDDFDIVSNEEASTADNTVGSTSRPDSPEWAPGMTNAELGNRWLQRFQGELTRPSTSRTHTVHIWPANTHHPFGTIDRYSDDTVIWGAPNNPVLRQRQVSPPRAPRAHRFNDNTTRRRRAAQNDANRRTEEWLEDQHRDRRRRPNRQTDPKVIWGGQVQGARARPQQGTRANPIDIDRIPPTFTLPPSPAAILESAEQLPTAGCPHFTDTTAHANAEPRPLRTTLLQTLQLDGQLECSICVAPLYDAVTSTCGHTFCRRCATGVTYKESRDQRVCPTCRHPWGMKMRSIVLTHRPNFLLRALCEARFGPCTLRVFPPTLVPDI